MPKAYPTEYRAFLTTFEVNNGNPNGDPTNDNMPRHVFRSGLPYAQMSPECFKRKLRDYMQFLGHPVLYDSNSNKADIVDPHVVMKNKGEKQVIDEEKTFDAVAGELSDMMLGQCVTGKLAKHRAPVYVPTMESVDPVKIRTIEGWSTVRNDADNAKGENVEGTSVPTCRHVIDYALFRGIIEFWPHRAEQFKVTQDRLDLLVQCLLNWPSIDTSCGRNLKLVSLYELVIPVDRPHPAINIASHIVDKVRLNEQSLLESIGRYHTGAKVIEHCTREDYASP